METCGRRRDNSDHTSLALGALANASGFHSRPQDRPFMAGF
jgi:hypothetical protein